MYAVYDRIFDAMPAKNTVYTLYMYMALANSIHWTSKQHCSQVLGVHQIVYLGKYMNGRT